MFERYWSRVQSLLQRYVLVLEIGEGTVLTRPPSSPDDYCDDSAMRRLFGLRISPERQSVLEKLDGELALPYEQIGAEAADPGTLLFEQVRWEFGLSDLACDALWLMLAGAMSPEFMWLYRALWGDRERTLFDRVFLTHVLDPYGQRVAEAIALFEPGSPLIVNRLVVELQRGTKEEADGLLSPSRRLIRHLLGVEAGLPNVPGLVALHEDFSQGAQEEDPTLSRDMIQRLRVGFAGKKRFVLVGSENTGPLRLARRVMADQGAPLLEVHTQELIRGGEDALVLMMGEARLRRAGLYLDEVEVLERPEVPATVARRLWSLVAQARVPVFLRATYGLSVNMRLKVVGELEAVELRLRLPDPELRQEIWARLLSQEIEDAAAVERLAFTARAYPFGVGEIERSLRLARLHAMERDLRKPRLAPSDVESACNAISGQVIGKMAQRVRVLASWEDVVLPGDTRRVVDEMLRFGAYRKRVFEEQGYGARMTYGKGLTALFWGPPGTGKTFVSGLIARELGLELYRIELSQVVSKYIGETEQRLAQIFDEAAAGGMALLFDEADSLFAGRTEVKSSVDRYANLETNFLLQRIENHEGVIILTTNFQASIDEAFMRRLRFKAEFPMPEAEERAQLWQKMIPAGAPREAEIRFDILGEVYELSGGEIRNAVLRAAFYAVEAGVPLGIEHLDRAAQVEYREAGRLLGMTVQRWHERKKEREKRRAARKADDKKA